MSEHQHRWDEIDYEMPRTGGARIRVGWYCVGCGDSRMQVEKPADGEYAYPENYEDGDE